MASSPSRPVPSDASLLARVRQGSEGAATALHTRYAQQLLALARARTGGDLAARVDAEDIVQSVFGSFFRGASQGLYDAPTGEEIWGLLLVMALNKIRVKGRHHRAVKRDVRRTVGGDAIEGIEPPTTDEAAETLLKMVVEESLGRLPESHRQVVQLRLEGFEVREIAEKTGKSMRSTERILQDLRTRLAEFFELNPKESE